MPKFTKKQFATMCGIKTSDLSNYIARGKVILDGELINSEDQTNLYFYEKRTEYNRKKAAISGTTENTVVVDKQSNENSLSDTDPTSDAPVPDEEKNLNDRVAKKNLKEPNPELKFPAEHAPLTRNSKLDEELKTEQLKKEKINSSLLQSKLDKTRGDSIPTELVRNLLAVHTKSIATAFKNEAEKILVLFSTVRELTNSEYAQLRKSITEAANTAVRDAVEESKKAVDSIVSEYSQKKEVGEREL